MNMSLISQIKVIMPRKIIYLILFILNLDFLKNQDK